MKKNLLCLVLIILTGRINAQVVNIVPNQASLGQTLTTTISMASQVLVMSSPPLNLDDIYLQKGLDTIYSTNFILYPAFPFGGFADTITAIFTIPNTVPTGYYNVHVTTYDFFGGPIPMEFDNVLNAGFLINGSTGIENISLPLRSFVYLNPANNVSTLVIPASSEPFDLFVYDMRGRQIEARKISGNYILDKTKFIPGVYHYQLRDKNGNRYSGKFIIAE